MASASVLKGFRLKTNLIFINFTEGGCSCIIRYATRDFYHCTKIITPFEPSLIILKYFYPFFFLTSQSTGLNRSTKQVKWNHRQLFMLSLVLEKLVRFSLEIIEGHVRVIPSVNFAREASIYHWIRVYLVQLSKNYF